MAEELEVGPVVAAVLVDAGPVEGAGRGSELIDPPGKS